MDEGLAVIFSKVKNSDFTEEEKAEKAALRSYFAKNDDLTNSESTALRLCSAGDEKCAYLRRLIPESDIYRILNHPNFTAEEKATIRTYFTKNYALVSSANAALRSCSTEKEKCDYLKNLISESVLEKANECWSKSQNVLTKLIELENFIVTNHIFAENINIARIPTIKKKPMFILHSLPDLDNDQLITESYVQKEKLLELRNKEEDQNILITDFTEKFKNLIPTQEHLPIVIDESQAAIKKFEYMFTTTLADRQLRPFFSILLRTVLDLGTNNLCLILSGTGMAFDDMKIYTTSAIAKSGGPTSENFFTINDGFYEFSEMKEFILRFLPLNDSQMTSTFNIFQGRRRFVVQFLEHAILETFSISHSNLDDVKKVVWNKVRDVTIFSMFSRWTKYVRGDGVAEMVQYGFAQLDSIDDPENLTMFQKDAITVRIAEPLPILAFIEYVKENPENTPEVIK
ncbi:14519_t:CDS:2, partial [Racocetra fulgida]